MEEKRERERGGTASKLARRRRRPTERDKFDFIALLELMLEARTAIGGDGGEPLKELSERGTATRSTVGQLDRWFSDGGGKAEE